MPLSSCAGDGRLSCVKGLPSDLIAMAAADTASAPSAAAEAANGL